MGNHLHLLLKEGKEPLKTVMRRICGSNVFWYFKILKGGYLFQDRYKSEPVDDDEYFLAVLRYIFNNPIKAGIVTKIQDYRWTNYKDYFKGINKTDIDFVFNIFNTDREKAIRRFFEHINKENADKCLDITEKQRLTDDDARKIIKIRYKIDHAIDIQKFDVDKRNIYLKDLKERYGLSMWQIERLTGISRGVIQRL